MQDIVRSLLSGLIGLSIAFPLFATPPTSQELEFFEKKIRPLLAEKCFRCHSAAKKQRGGLMLDSRETILKGGDSGPAVVAKHPEKSLLIKAIHYTDPDFRMPPNSKLAAGQIKDLETWVKMGLPWPESTATTKKLANKKFNLAERAKHWSFQPMKRPEVPTVKNKDWPLSPMDAFILAKLEKAGLSPNPPADRRTLIRRVYFDVIGLPPTPKEVDEFVNDKSPNAYEKVVDRLLASPHYGERWGRHWLDLVRFAETAGHEFDFEIPEAYLYRDYVIRALNADVPYDQFVKEHIAGDLLAKPRKHPTKNFNESIIGTGFFHLGESKHSPVDIRSDSVDRLDNQIDVFSKTFLGLTLSCARCHDHKFDPITTKDYYAMMGYLESARYQRAFIDDPTPIRETLAKMRQVRKETSVPAKKMTYHLMQPQLSKLLSALAQPNDANRAVIQQVRKEVGNNPQHPFYPLLHLSEVAANAQAFQTRKADLLKRLTTMGGNRDGYQTFADFDKTGLQNWFTSGEAFAVSSGEDVTLAATGNRYVTDLVIPGEASSGLLTHQAQGTLRSPTFHIPKKFIHYKLRGKGSKLNLIIDGFLKIRNPIYGGLTIGINHGDGQRWYTQNVSMWTGHRSYIEFLDNGNGFLSVDEVVFSDNPRPPADPANTEIIRWLKSEKSGREFIAEYETQIKSLLSSWKDGKDLTPDQVKIVRTLLQSKVLQAQGSGEQASENILAKIRTGVKAYQQLASAKLPSSARVLAMQDGTPVNQKVMIRGNHKKLGEAVPNRFLEVFVGDEQPPNAGSGRMQLAEQLVNPDNPLTARVMINRIWKHHFGTGIVRSVDNFGILGEQPTHPELLDWLATEFIRQGWSMKKMHKMILMSRTYQMSSKTNPDAKTIDPNNSLLHRMPVKRLEGEIIRDALLTVSGRLNKTMFGRGVMPHLTPFMSGRGRPGRSGPLDGDGRRSIYINVRRNFLTPMFLVFDYPVPFSTIGRRSVSNVPAQALTMMNNPFVLQQCDLWGKKVAARNDLNREQKIRWMFAESLSREPSERETEQMLRFLDNQGKLYNNANAPETWRDLCHVVVNLKEFIFIR